MFTAEVKFKPEDKKTVKGVIRLLPKYFTIKYLRQLMFYIFITNFGLNFINTPMSLNFIRKGLDKTTLVNITTMLTPIALLVACLSQRWMRKGKMITVYHLTCIVGCLVCLLLVAVFWDYSKNHNLELTIKFLFLLGMANTFTDQGFNFLFGFINSVVDEELGSTSITLMTCIWNLSISVPETLGLKLSQYFNFEIYCVFFLIMTIALLFWKMGYAKETDLLDPS
jgi:hypothetical protein